MPRFHHSVLLYNGQAGASTKETIMELAVPVLAEASKHLEIIQTDTEDDFMDLCRKYSLEADIIFIAGGDGTIHSALQALSSVSNPSPVGILPTGTCNDFARTLEIPLAIDQAAELLVTGDVKKVDTVKINDKSYLNFAGIGVITDASLNIDPSLKERYGKLSYFMSGLQSLKQSVPFQIEMTVDGVEYEEEAVLVLVMNGSSIGTHSFPLSTIDPFDGLLDIFVIQDSSISAILEWFSLSRQDITATELEHVTHLHGREITLRTKDEKDVDTDGEVHLKTPVEIEIQPGSFKLLLPSGVQENE